MKKEIEIPATVDEYMRSLPPDSYAVLEGLRQTIKSAAPYAEGVISYGMPGYKHHGMLVFYAAFKNHCSFFPASSTIMKLEEVKKYKTSAVHFSLQ